jgi:DNA-binding PadR family transcriptional regulator
MRHGVGGLGDRDAKEWMCSRRTLAQGDLRLVALALIAEAPRHGYDIIKRLREKTADWYSPSPGIVYPTLTCLQQAGY